MNSKLLVRWFLSLAIGLPLITNNIQAQNYPTKPIRLIVPFSPGGPSDVVGRLLQPKLSEALGQSVIIDNRAGAAGIIGTSMVANAQPDGYTLVQVPSSHAINATLYEKLPFDSIRSFSPVILISSAPFVLVAHPSLPVKTVEDLISMAKAKPGQLSYGSGGVGSGSHMAGAMLSAMAKLEITHVPYKGLGPTFMDLMAARLHFVFSPLASAMPYLEAGRLKAVALTGTSRSRARPELPIIAEVLPGYRAISWDGVLAPADTPQEIVSKVNAAYNRVLALPEIRKTFSDQAIEVGGGTPQDFAAFIEADIARFAKVIKALGIRVENL